MSDSVRPHRQQPTKLPRPWDSPGKNTGVGCHFFLQCMKVKSEVKSLSRVPPLATPRTAAYQAPPSMGFSRQDYWSGLPFPSPGNLPDPGIEPWSPAVEADALTSEPPGETMTNLDSVLKNRDITLLTKVSIVKAMVFPVVMYRCESWTIILSSVNSFFLQFTEELMLLNCGVGEDS